MGMGYERIASDIEGAIRSGRLRTGERLPPVRKMARDLGVSGATVAAAYELLARRGRTRGEVGRGTFVTQPGSGEAAHDGRAAGIGGVHRFSGQAAPPVPWRRRAMNGLVARMRAAHPEALDCTTGRPDAAVLPHRLLADAWRAELAETEPADLQYASAEPIEPLVREVLPWLARDGVRATAAELAVGNSTQQLMMLALDVLDARAAASGAPHRIAVEEPGFYTAYDTFERRGYELAGVAVDADGAVPTSLRAVLEAGACAVLLTPRAHNPTGASWTPERRHAIADVLGLYPGVLVLEDDYSGVSAARPGSLFSDPRTADRTICLRSFSKSIAPDLRVAIAVARPPLRAALVEAKSYADGWTSHLPQRVLARVLSDPARDDALDAARRTYAERRAALTAAVDDRLAPTGGATLPAADGVNVWVRLPGGVDSTLVVERAATLGALFAPSEPFYVRPGHAAGIRLNAGVLTPEQAERAAAVLADAVLDARGATPPAMV